MQKTLSYIALILLLILGVIGGWWLRGCSQVPPTPVEPKTDTLYLPDTSSYAKPDPAPGPKVIIKEIPVPVYIADSTAIDSLLMECARLEKVGDSLQLVLQRTQRHYTDSTYDAWVSGIDPRLDSIKTYHTNMVITMEIPVYKTIRKPWGIGVQAGATYVPQQGVQPYIGLGISYNILNF